MMPIEKFTEAQSSSWAKPLAASGHGLADVRRQFAYPRFMCSWDTDEARVRQLAADIREEMSA